MSSEIVRIGSADGAAAQANAPGSTDHDAASPATMPSNIGLAAWEARRRNQRRFVVRRILTAFAFILVAWPVLNSVNWRTFDLFGGTRSAEKIDAAIDDQRLGILRVGSEAAAPAAASAASQPRQPPLPPAPYPASDLTCLAKAIYHEARGEPFEGRVAVAQVVLNRARKSGESLCAVVSKGVERGEKCQFSFVCRFNVLPQASDARWLDAAWLAEEVAAGRAYLRELRDAEHYHSIDVRPVWRLGLNPIRRIGRHIFYNPKDVEPDLSLAAEVIYRWDEPTEAEIIADVARLPATDTARTAVHAHTAATATTSASRQTVRIKPQRARTIGGSPPERYLPFSDTGGAR